MLNTIAAGSLSGRAFDHVLIIMFENQYRGYVLGESLHAATGASGHSARQLFRRNAPIADKLHRL